MRLYTCLSACALTMLTHTAVLASSVQAIIATEGRCAVFTGAMDGTGLEFMGADAKAPAAGAPPATWRCSFETEDERYLYLVAWGYQTGSYGVLAEILFNGLEVLSGDPAWEVYAANLRVEGADSAPTAADLAAQIHSANRQFAWRKAAVTCANGVGPRGTISEVSADADWMWLPSSGTTGAGATGPLDTCVIFRISPTELWPEIELWHGRNVGLGPTAEGNIFGRTRQRLAGGGGRRGGTSGGGFDRGPVVNQPPLEPFNDFSPPNARSIPPAPPSDDTVPPILPPRPPRPSDSTSTAASRPPTPNDVPLIDDPPGDDDTPPDDPDQPTVPEPSSALLMLALGALIRRRRDAR